MLQSLIETRKPHAYADTNDGYLRGGAFVDRNRPWHMVGPAGEALSGRTIYDP